MDVFRINYKEGIQGWIPYIPTKEGIMTERLLPTGTCWCGCGKETAIGSFFLSGHDKIAEAAVICSEYGSVAAFLVRHGYGPGGKNPGEVLAICKQQAKHKAKRPHDLPPSE